QPANPGTSGNRHAMPLAIALRLIVALLASLLIVSLAQAQETRFTHAGVTSDAKRYETYLKANWQPKRSAKELRSEGDKVMAAGNDPRAAARAYAQAVVFDGGDTDSWAG